MPTWKETLASVTADVEAHFDMLKQRLDRRLGSEPICVAPYRGYGSAEQIVLKGRVLESSGVGPVTDNDSIWDNLVNMYNRFESDEIPGARVLARFAGAEQQATADEEGFFEVRLAPAEPLPTDRYWHPVELTLLEPRPEGRSPATATGEVFIPPPAARFGIVSDIDDTILQTGVTNLLMMARTVFLGNARTRLPFPGVAALYRALHAGAPGPFVNPIFYVSSSPWNIYDVLADFFELQQIPKGAMFLRDWGTSGAEVLPLGHKTYKLASIQRILDHYPSLPFLLIGDSGQEDPEIYREVVRLYPNRVLAIYIRNVDRGAERVAAVQALAEEVMAAGSALVLADDTLTMARHAAEKGWIAAGALAAVEADKATDEAPPSAVEKLLGEETQAPTVVLESDRAVDDGAVETLLEESKDQGDQPPTIIVEGNQ